MEQCEQHLDIVCCRARVLRLERVVHGALEDDIRLGVWSRDVGLGAQ